MDPSTVNAPAITAKSSPRSHERWLVAGICCLLTVMIWAVFGQLRQYDFINFDDDVYVYQNPPVAGGLSWKSIQWTFTQVHSSNWHPVTWLSHMLDCQLFGLNPGAQHLVNVLFHTLATLSLFFMFRALTGALWRSAFVAAVFAIHPLHVESVAWIAERKDVLSGLFFILTIGAYVRYVRERSAARYLAVLFLFALALMSKPMVVTLPIILLLLDYWPLQRFPQFGQFPWRLIAEKLPLLLLSAAVAIITLCAQHDALSSLSFASRLGNALVSYAIYMGQMFYPTGLAVFYPYPEHGLAIWAIIGAASLLAGISIVVFFNRRQRPWLVTGWLWYLVMLLPVIGIIQVGAQAHADRYTYLPEIGLYALFVWMIADCCTRWRKLRFALGIVSVAIIIALAFCARIQSSYWMNSQTLWTHALASTADNLTARINLGNALLQAGKPEEAMTHYAKALQIQPDNAEANVSYGYILAKQGKADEAAVYLNKALKIKPDHAQAHNDLGNILAQSGQLDQAIDHFQKALHSKPDYAEANYNLGNALTQKGKLDEAITAYQKALQIKPGYVEASYNLGNTFFVKGDMERAVQCYQTALRLKPDYAKACYNLGSALLQEGKLDDAASRFQQELQMNPKHAETCYNLGDIDSRQGKWEEAVVYYQKALSLRPDWAEAQYSLGVSFFQRGNEDAAIDHYQKALQIKPDYTDAENNLAWELATSPRPSLRDGRRAVELAQKANQTSHDQDPDILGTLAAALAEAGRFDEAIQNIKHAMALTQANQSDQLAQLDSQLKLYQSGLPFHAGGK